MKFKHIFDKAHSSPSPPNQKFYFEGIIKNYLPFQGILVNLHKNEYILGKLKEFDLSEYGMLMCENGDQFEGFMKKGRKQGKCNIFWSQLNERFEGEYIRDKKNGSGKYWYANGDKYEGEWKNDNKHGYGKNSCFEIYALTLIGTYTWQDGRKYQGFFFDNLREGHGNFHFPNGVEFSGEWKNDLREGRGVLTNTKGDTLTGTWIKDSLHGKVIRRLKIPDE